LPRFQVFSLSKPLVSGYRSNGGLSSLFSLDFAGLLLLRLTQNQERIMGRLVEARFFTLYCPLSILQLAESDPFFSLFFCRRGLEAKLQGIKGVQQEAQRITEQLGGEDHFWKKKVASGTV